MPSQGHDRFDDFSAEERAVLKDALANEAAIDPLEDPSFPAWVKTANHLLDELAEASTDAADATWTPVNPWERGREH